MASDAFFPFRDGIDSAAEHGISAIIQPGGSMRDDPQVETLQDLHTLDAHPQVSDVQDWLWSCLCAHPTAPSRVTPSRAWASTANSIGSSLNTCLQNPLTIMLTESSSEMPLCRQ